MRHPSRRDEYADQRQTDDRAPQYAAGANVGFQAFHVDGRPSSFMIICSRDADDRSIRDRLVQSGKARVSGHYSDYHQARREEGDEYDAQRAERGVAVKQTSPV